MSEAWRGHIRVPHFQRDFRWGRQDVIRLFDSIIKGYPVGSLLLWLRPAAAQRIQLGSLTIDAPDTGRAFWVVDGQQRLTSLANALHEDGQNDPRFALTYDLKGKRFAGRSPGDESWHIPLPILFDLQKLVRWFSENPEISELLNEATAVAKIIRQFRVPAYQVENEDETVLTDIFDRMNNYGKRLSRAEIFSALYAGDEGADATTLDIDTIAENIDSKLRFGIIDDDTVLRGILARRAPDVTREIRSEFDDQDRRGTVEFRGEGRDAAYQAGEEALTRAVQFLQREAGVPHFSLLSYRYLLIVLTRLFAHHPKPDKRNLQLLRRWYWRASVVGPEIFKGNVTGGMRLLASRVYPNDLSRSVTDLLDAVNKSDRSMPNLHRFRTNEASTKMLLCAWWAAKPRSLTTGQPFEAQNLADLLTDRPTAADAVHYIFPRRSTPPQFSMWAANRILLPSEDEPVDEVLSFLANRKSEIDDRTWIHVLRSHNLNHAVVDALAAGKIADFIEGRDSLLQANLEAFLERECEWKFEDTPSLSDLVVDDEDDVSDRP
ncbi:DUF262 domain-containing protein [Pseudonocardia pini]|uniref:DUF262 domain-containing protein n=1 Tax=Pseudonocardia pini TaxID=2758030 RepID=UPI0028AC5B63|nr:DUF262 domain-containing protein [Pseudonocardia pini]